MGKFKIRSFGCRKVFKHFITGHQWELGLAVLSKTEAEAIRILNDSEEVAKASKALQRAGYKLMHTMVEPLSKSGEDSNLSFLSIRCREYTQ